MWGGENRRSPQVPGDITDVVLPHNLLQACEDGFDMVIHELGTENTLHRWVFGDKESAEDLGASNIYVQMYRIDFYEAVVVCIFDAGCALELLSITLAVGG